MLCQSLTCVNYVYKKINSKYKFIDKTGHAMVYLFKNNVLYLIALYKYEIRARAKMCKYANQNKSR